MIEKIKKQLLIWSTAILFLTPMVGGTLIASATAPAGCNQVSGAVANGAQNSLPNNNGVTTGGNAINCSSTGASTGSLTSIARTVITWFSILVGAASVIMIIYGGFRYIISGGQSDRVGAAKNSLIYAIIGLAIVALAQLIVHFVLTQSNNVSSQA